MTIRAISEEQIDKVDQTPIIPGTEKRKSIFTKNRPSSSQMKLNFID